MPKTLHDIRNYPKRSGTSQPLRSNRVLMGEAVKIDERTIADFILFAQKLSRYLIYYNENNIPQGDWQSFLYNDITYQLAIKSADKSKYWEAAWKELMENVEGAGGAVATDDDYKKYYTWRFDLLYSLVGKMIEAFANSSSLPQWNNGLEALYSSAHLNTIKFLMDIYYASSTSLLVNDTGIFSFKDLQLSQKKMVDEQFIQYGKEVTDLLSSDHFIPNGDFIFGTAVTISEQVTAASEYLDELATQLISIYESVNALAEKNLSFTLTQYDTHQPHVGLFYAYLQLSEEHRNEINTLLIKHLDFYYKQVLCVKEKPYTPDQAFVVAELVKNSNEHFIPAATLLSAGKDSAKKDIFYKTMSDIVVNKTALAEIRSFTFIKDSIKKNDSILPRGLFASSVANSLDGKGKALAAGESWDAFRVSDNENDCACSIGLSFYAALLHEAPGEERQFELDLEFASSIINKETIVFVKKYGTLRVLTESDPLVIDINDADTFNNGRGLKISFTISGKTKLSKASPNASLIFGNKLESVDASFLDVFKMFQTERLVKLLLVLSHHVVEVTHAETAAGITDLSSAFAAFGGQPKVGSSFSVIEPLLLNRTVNELAMTIEWSAETERFFSVNISYPSQPGIKRNIDNGQAITNFLLLTNTNTFFATGEIKLRLNQDLGHTTYANDITRAILKQNEATISSGNMISAISDESALALSSTNLSVANQFKDFFATGLPDIPYTPMIKSIQLTVSLSENILSKETSNLFNQYAHGIKKINSIKNAFLIPATRFEGELYIGLKNIVASQSLKILIQVEEGTADPTLDNPATQWQYLLNNEWRNFETSFIEDDTKGLIQSGILSIVLPDANLTANTLLPAGLLWLRAAVPFKQSPAVCKIIDVHTQAVMVQFDDHENDPAYIGTNIPANAITGLFPKQAHIKKILQPYPSFGGRQTETPAQLYTRTSERLRHKHRAITVWDYEHLILEAFPQVYKVKALMHACQSKKDTNKIMAKAGQVLVLVIPKTTAQSAIYKPMLSKSGLIAINEFLRPLASPFVQLNVINSLFEEISLNIEVSFLPFVKDRPFYENLLQDDVKRFLSPWAFDNGAEPEFSGIIYKSVLINFIEELGYIDFVIRLEIMHEGSRNGDMAAASSPVSILISADKHSIKGMLYNSANKSVNTKTIACS